MINDETNIADLEKIESYYVSLNIKCQDECNKKAHELKKLEDKLNTIDNLIINVTLSYLGNNIRNPI